MDIDHCLRVFVRVQRSVVPNVVSHPSKETIDECETRVYKSKLRLTVTAATKMIAFLEPWRYTSLSEERLKTESCRMCGRQDIPCEQFTRALCSRAIVKKIVARNWEETGSGIRENRKWRSSVRRMFRGNNI